VCRGRQVRDGGAYGCAVPRAYANLNPGLPNPNPNPNPCYAGPSLWRPFAMAGRYPSPRTWVHRTFCEKLIWRHYSMKFGRWCRMTCRLRIYGRNRNRKYNSRQTLVFQTGSSYISDVDWVILAKYGLLIVWPSQEKDVRHPIRNRK